MEKKCTHCGIVKIKEVDFSQKGKSKSGVMKYKGICRVCYNARDRKRRAEVRAGSPRRIYVRDPELIKLNRKVKQSIYNKQKRIDTQKWISNYKRSLFCQDCGISFKEVPWLCDFHHEDPSTKEFEISKANSRSIAIVASEIDKCIAVCANCHRTRHYLEKSKVYESN